MPRIEILNGSMAGTSVDLGPGEAHEVGTSPGAGVHLQDPGVDGEHARVLDTGGGYVVVDLGSDGGTSVNGSRLPPQSAHALRAGDEILIGEVLLRFVDGHPSGIRPTIALGPPLALDAEDEEEDEPEQEDEPEEDPTFMRTLFVAPPTDDPIPAASGGDRSTRRMKPLAEAPGVPGGPTHAELEAALRGVEETIAAAREACEQRVNQARKTVQAAQARFHQAAQVQSKAANEAKAALRAAQEELRDEREARARLQAELDAAPPTPEAPPADAAELDELREQLEELNEDLIAISDERDQLREQLGRLGKK